MHLGLLADLAKDVIKDHEPGEVGFEVVLYDTLKVLGGANYFIGKDLVKILVSEQTDQEGMSNL